MGKLRTTLFLLAADMKPQQKASEPFVHSAKKALSVHFNRRLLTKDSAALRRHCTAMRAPCMQRSKCPRGLLFFIVTSAVRCVADISRHRSAAGPWHVQNQTPSFFK